ncbi:MAG: 4-alpha-glucanotransferase, partial [Candidatus Hinthialibacter sp.]
VEELRHRFEFPGMSILQFAFGSDADCIDLPHNYSKNLVAYSGTHDNDTTVGWWESKGEGSTRSPQQVKKEKDYAKRYLRMDGTEINWTFIQTLMASVAQTVIFPMQDVLGLGTEARMNRPGQSIGNWQWRCKEGQLTESISQRLSELCETYGRVPK